MTVAYGVELSFVSMGSDVTIRVVDPAPEAEAATTRAREAIEEVARHLTRFDPHSALSLANAEPDRWHDAPSVLVGAITESFAAHLLTDGLFDPRVGGTLEAWGYDRDYAEVTAGPWALGIHRARRGTPVERGQWRPGVTRDQVHLGGSRIDLGGIGKGLAVRHAMQALAGAGSSILVDAGGDEYLGGPGPDGTGWKVGVEDPLELVEHVLVLAVVDLAVATSSIARQRWTVAGVPVHHLVDPRTQTPGGAGLAAVTVLHPDPAWAEVWSKTLYLCGADDIAAYAADRDLAAAWVTVDGTVLCSERIRPHVIWQVTR